MLQQDPHAFNVWESSCCMERSLRAIVCYFIWIGSKHQKALSLIIIIRTDCIV